MKAEMEIKMNELERSEFLSVCKAIVTGLMNDFHNRHYASAANPEIDPPTIYYTEKSIFELVEKALDKGFSEGVQAGAKVNHYSEPKAHQLTEQKSASADEQDKQFAEDLARHDWILTPTFIKFFGCDTKEECLRKLQANGFPKGNVIPLGTKKLRFND